MMFYFLAFFGSFFLCGLYTYCVRWFARRMKIVDKPIGVRKIHKKEIPLLGGFAIYLAFFSLVVVFYLFFGAFGDIISKSDIIGLFIASTVLMIGGFFDDRYDIGRYSFFFPLLAVLIVLYYGIGIERITNPFGGVFELGNFTVNVPFFGGEFYSFAFVSIFFTLSWLLGMTYTTKLLDGIDGLVTGLTAIGAFVIFLLSTTTIYYQPEVAILSIILCGSCLGFLLFNFNPASIFLGEGGSVFTGFMLGILAIIAGGKIATALLVMGIPILDTFWIIVRRLLYGRSITSYDDLHVHHRLLKSGLTQRQTVFLLYALSFSFGITTIFFQSFQKLLTLIVLLICMIVLGGVLVIRQKKE